MSCNTFIFTRILHLSFYIRPLVHGAHLNAWWQLRVRLISISTILYIQYNTTKKHREFSFTRRTSPRACDLHPDSGRAEAVVDCGSALRRQQLLASSKQRMRITITDCSGRLRWGLNSAPLRRLSLVTSGQALEVVRHKSPRDLCTR